MSRIDSTSQQLWVVHAVCGTVCLTLAGAGYWFGLGPMTRELDQRQGLTQTLELSQDDLQLRRGVLERLEDKFLQSQQELEVQPVDLQPASMVNRRLANLSQLAQEHDLVLTASSIGGEQRLAYYSYLPIELGGQGDFGNVVAFLGKLYEHYPDISVRTFDLNRGGDGPSRGARAGFSLGLSWFVQPPQTAQGTP